MRNVQRRCGALAVALSLAVPAVAASAATTAPVQKKTAAKQKSQAPKQAQTKQSSTGAYPDRNVIDLATGKAFNLSTLASTKEPTLLFIWAPS